MLTVLPFGWLFYIHGTLTAETFVTVIILSLGMAAPIVAVFNFVDTLAQVGTTVAQVDEILKAEEQEHGTQPVSLADHVIEVKNVSFGYHDGTEVLHNVSLSIPQKGMTALVGPSGSGKSTLAKLIAGFWDVKDAPIVILDEATAYIDPENEAVIQQAVAKLVANKTVIVIAHRLSTITDADTIAVVQDGRLVAQDKHESLLESCPLYWEMWQAHIGAKDGDME